MLTEPDVWPLKLKEYVLEEVLSRSEHSVVYRASRVDGTRFIIKANTQEAGTLSIRHDYHTSRKFSSNHLLCYTGMQSFRGGVAVISEDFGAVSLAELIPPGGYPVNEFLHIGCQLAQGLGEIHRKNIVHNNLHTGNIVMNPESRHVKIIDFKASNPGGGKIDQGEIGTGPLEFISPEQTGRINRPVDYRTDLYSLGVVFYNLLAGRPPFESSDSLSLIHSHIAHPPPPLESGRDDLPEVLVRIVMLLLEKNAEDRYQSIRGLRADLEKCLDLFVKTSGVEWFSLSEASFSRKLSIPEKMYGRIASRDRVISLFEHVCRGGNRLLFVAGNAGVGKTMLVNELKKEVEHGGGFFISGKFDQQETGRAYGAIINALQELSDYILRKPDREISTWRSRILEAVGENGKIITELVKDLELIIGEQPPVPKLDPIQSKNRFDYLLKRFIRVFSDRSHPLVMFIDDLQWADTASLNVIRSLTGDNGLTCFLLIGAYRDNEVAPGHPMNDLLRELAKIPGGHDLIELAPLQSRHIKELIIDTFACPPSRAEALAGLVFDKTAGNIFFVREFLQALYRKKELVYSLSGGWQWDEDSVARMGVTDNVVELIADQIRTMPDTVQTLLQEAACIGNRFRTGMLAVLNKCSEESVDIELSPAIASGVILKRGNGYQFIHDRCQEAAYTLIPEEKRSALHFAIGNILDSELKNKEDDPGLFWDAVNHLNAGASQICNAAERVRVARLNLEAGMTSKDSAAFAQLLDYCKNGLSLLTPEDRRLNYSLSFALSLGAAQGLYLTNAFDAAKVQFNDLKAMARNRLDKAKVFELEIIVAGIQQETAAAIESLKNAVGLFGIELPDDSNGIRRLAESEMDINAKLLSGRRISSLADHHSMQDPGYKAVLRLIAASSLPLFYTGIDLMHYVFLKGVNISLEHGNSPVSPYIYVCHGVTLRDNHHRAHQFGQLALALAEKDTGKAVAGTKLCQYIGSVINHWVRHLDESVDILLQGYLTSLSSGDLSAGIFCLTSYLSYRNLRGDNLQIIRKEWADHDRVFQKTGNPYILSINRYLIQYVRALQGHTVSLSSMTDDGFDEQSELSRLENEGAPQLWFHFHRNRERLLFFAGDMERALKAAEQADLYAHTMDILPVATEHCFYYCLILGRKCDAVDEGERGPYLARMEGLHAKMEKWAGDCPENYLHKQLLMAAELFRIKNNKAKAVECYNLAIESARQNGFIQNQAIACELAAGFHQGSSNGTVGAMYYKAAMECYAGWGAGAKLEQLKQARGGINDLIHTQRGKKTDPEPADLDIHSLLKASRLISGEMDTEKLVDKILTLIIENAGARYGALLLKKNDHWQMDAKGSVSEGGISILRTRINMQMDMQNSELPVMVVNYVVRSRKFVVMDNALENIRFGSDPYIRKSRPVSVLCLPVIRKGEVVAVLYLENNLTCGAFTRDRIQTLTLLSSQAAISIENARLYFNLKQSYREVENIVAERTAELASANKELERISVTDSLTGLYNRRFFEKTMEKEWSRHERNKLHLSVLMCDIDYFKLYNYTYGHQKGDLCIASVARALKECARRPGDVAARYGGEEFIIILPQTGERGADLVAEMVIEKIAAMEIPHGASEVKNIVSVSLGLATLVPEEGQEPLSLIRKADRALYVSKKSGRDRWTRYSPERPL